MTDADRTSATQTARMRQKLVHDHDYMIELAEAVIRSADIQGPDLTPTVNGLRIELSRAIRAHCAEEARAIARPGATRLPSAVTRRYHEELANWGRALVACNSQWPGDRIRKDRIGFLSAFGPLVKALRERVRWEQEELYPLLPLLSSDDCSGPAASADTGLYDTPGAPCLR